MHALFCSNCLCTVKDEMLLEWNAVTQLQFTAPALPFVFPSLSRGIVQPLHIERSEVKHPTVIELDDEWNALRPSATSADTDLFLEQYRPLVYRA